MGMIGISNSERICSAEQHRFTWQWRRLDRLVVIAADECAPFHDVHTAFTDVETNGDRETSSVRSKEFTLWVPHQNSDARRDRRSLPPWRRITHYPGVRAG